jgi:hypothetical protein
MTQSTTLASITGAALSLLSKIKQLALIELWGQIILEAFSPAFSQSKVSKHKFLVGVVLIKSDLD